VQARVVRIRRLDAPWIAIAFVAIWGALVAFVHIANRAGAETPKLCPLYRTTGIPCPTCGGTRAAFAWIDLRPLEALAWNPLIATMLVFAGAYVIARTVLGRGLRFSWTARSRRAAWVVGTAVVLANWAWVIAREFA